MGNANKNLFWPSIILVCLAANYRAQVIISPAGGTVSNPFMLAEDATYDLNFTMSNTLIPAGSSVMVLLSDKFLIAPDTLHNCRVSTSNTQTVSDISQCEVSY